MRMDIFDELTDEAKVNVIEQFVRIYGVDAVLNDGNLYECMNEFECGLYRNGDICPADDLNTLEDLQDEMARNSNQNVAEVLLNAMCNARTLEFPDEGEPNDFGDLIRRQDVYNVRFDDCGEMVYIDERSRFK